MTLSLRSSSAIATSTPKKISVCHAPVSVTMSFHVSTPVTRRIAMPAKAVVVASTFSCLPRHHRMSSSTKVAARIHSLRDIEPLFFSSSRARAGASGVFLSVGA
ncbi:Uncharacterised protein [Mycobacteroides abscessus subsp. abscessus]|nr:Uncharacterised protein [Mycobacteroides abscessus subsp. abscessus]